MEHTIDGELPILSRHSLEGLGIGGKTRDAFARQARRLVDHESLNWRNWTTPRFRKVQHGFAHSTERVAHVPRIGHSYLNGQFTIEHGPVRPRLPHQDWQRPMSYATLWGAFRALDIRPDRMTLHGFRAMARTILDEVLGRLDIMVSLDRSEIDELHKVV